MNTLKIQNISINDKFWEDFATKWNFYVLKNENYPIIDISNFDDDKYFVLKRIDKTEEYSEYVWTQCNQYTIDKIISKKLSNEKILFENIDRINKYMEVK